MSMILPNGKSLSLDEGILCEPVPDGSGIVLWLRGARDGRWIYWERLATVPGARVVSDADLAMVAMSSLRVRQEVRGVLGSIWQYLRGATEEHVWILPNNQTATQFGERRTDLYLVWAIDSPTLDEQRLRQRWPVRKRLERLGPNLFVVSSEPATVTAPADVQKAQPAIDAANPRQQAEELLALARQKGDRSGECYALADLGLIHLREGNAAAAIPLLQAALRMTPEFGDRSREIDVMGNLGLAFLAAGQPACALQLLQQALQISRACGDRLAEKIALSNLGFAHAFLHEPHGAILHYEQALAICREVGDRQQEAESLWYLAIQKAELGLRDDAVALAQTGLELFRELGHPESEWLADQLQRYRDGNASGPEGTPAKLRAPSADGGITTSMWTQLPPSRVEEPVASGPGILRMAITAAKSFAHFAESGFKTVPSDLQRQRLEVCATCPQHTGMRCRVCGCFTRAKAWLPHERCPLGKWPS